MKRVLLSFLLLCVVSSAFAQNGKITITSDEIKWDCPNQIVCSEKNDTIYIAFGKDEEIVLTPDIPSLKNRSDLNATLSADKKIFVQTCEGGKAYSTAGMLVNKNNLSGVYDHARIIIKKEQLPIVLKFKDTVINLVEFDANNVQQCELIRKRANAYQKLPDCQSDTLTHDELRGFTKNAMSLRTSNNAWKITAKYFINDTECELQNNKISMTEDLWASVKNSKNIKVRYEIDCEHRYFSHKRDGVYYDICIIPVNEWSWWSYTWRAIVGISFIVLVIAIVMYVRNSIKKKRKSFKQHIREEYYEELTSDDEPETKLALISQLLSNVDDKFRERVLSIIGIETSPSVPVTPKEPVLPSQNTIIEELNKKIEELNAEIAKLSKQIADNDMSIATLQGKIDELSLKLAKSIKDNKLLIDKNTTLNEKVEELRLEIDSLKSIIADKDKQIEQHLQKMKTLQDQLASISRQNMYLLQIDDVLKEISDDILVAVENVEDDDLKKKLVLPLLNGVNGLDEGLTTYYKRWQDRVMKTQKNFFGKDLYEMKDDEVKTKLVSGFLKNLAQGDTFSKLTRLYMYIQVDWINDILIKNKFNVDKIEQIFNRLKILFNDFGIEIIYPRLFVDKMNDQQYTFDPRCEVFKLFPINEEMRMLYSKQTDLIVDIIQIGVKLPSENYSRKAIVSIPNF